ncbi:amidohydrolase [Neolentinus lepideus HHB14362 ss-1]|uniref:Amidohydrolase n=1 Tax=Neolentinus lepideus HHB14362 ss-1 TaxID=1314782 RepID=A0A165UC60_9AGAM|nr:amidohydrolase [Neolentinus lepideus HHB14362 ss-1]
MADNTAGCFAGLLRPLRQALRPKSRQEIPIAGTAASKHLDTHKHVEETDEPAPVYLSCCNFDCGIDADSWSTLDKPPTYTAGRIYRSDIFDTIESSVTALDPSLREISLQIHDHPELMFQERFAHDTLTAFMSEHGFTVTKHYLGLETAWKAEWANGSGGRVLGINSEMDALPEIGHACGHNLIAIAGVGVALAVKQAMQKHDITGKIVLLGTPAEEGGGGKAILLERGGYDEMDACIMCHPMPGPERSAAIVSSLSMQPIEIEYFGHAAHAAAFPWEGTNALDAAFLAYSAIAVLRQQIKPDYRVHGVIKAGNLVSNIIPDYVKMVWAVRAPTKVELEVLRERVKACLESAAAATGCKTKVVLGRPYYDIRQNITLAQDFENVMLQYDFKTAIVPDTHSASTDFGNVSYGNRSIIELPALHPSFGIDHFPNSAVCDRAAHTDYLAIPTEPNGGNHTPAFATAAGTPEAHQATLLTVKGLAMTGTRLLDDSDFYQQIKQDFEKSKQTQNPA